MATNDFLPFATAGGANVLSQADYAALAALSSGFSSGLASSAGFNKVWRQATTMAAVVGQVIADAGYNAFDDGDITTKVTDLKAAIGTFAAGYNVAATGTNTITITLTPTPASLAALTGIPIRIRIATTNTGAVTINPNSLGATPLKHGDGTNLTGGELVAGAIIMVVLDSSGNFQLLAGGASDAAQTIITSTGTLTAVGTILGSSSLAFTATLMAANSIAKGKRLTFANIGAGTMTVSRAGSDTISVAGTTITTLPVATGDTLVLESDGSGTFYAIGGSAVLKYSAQFAVTTSGSGTCLALPGGYFLQMGMTGTIGAASSQAVTFPKTFPNGVLSIVATRNGVASSSQASDYVTSISAAGATIVNESPSNAAPFSWWAVGN